MRKRDCNKWRIQLPSASESNPVLLSCSFFPFTYFLHNRSIDESRPLHLLLVQKNSLCEYIFMANRSGVTSWRHRTYHSSFLSLRLSPGLPLLLIGRNNLQICSVYKLILQRKTTFFTAKTRVFSTDIAVHKAQKAFYHVVVLSQTPINR